MKNKKEDYHLELSEDEMKDYGYRVVDILVEHFKTQHLKKPVFGGTREEMDATFLEDPPEKGSDAKKVLEFVTEKVLKRSNIVSHPKFFSFVPGPSNYISTMADTLATGFNIFSGGWITSPAASEIEIVTTNWLLSWFGFPTKSGGGIFTSGGSMANLSALKTARRQKCENDFSNATIYVSDQTHSSNLKAIKIIGFKKEQVRIIPTDSRFKLSLTKLKQQIVKDQLAGKHPFCIIASAGTTNTGTVDPLEEISAICKKQNIWMHVDGAYGGAAILCKKNKKLLKGIEKADSITVDPHKWFFQPYEIGCLLVKNHKWLKNTFSEKADYLRDVQGNESEINFYDHGVQLTRRFRALKFYMSLKTFGLRAFANAVTYSINLTEKVEELLRKNENWEIIFPATLAVINFRYNPAQLSLSEKKIAMLNQKISQRIIDSTKAMLVTTNLKGKVVLRMCLINPRTRLNDVKQTLDLCHQLAKEILKEHSF